MRERYESSVRLEKSEYAVKIGGEDTSECLSLFVAQAGLSKTASRLRTVAELLRENYQSDLGK